LSRFRTLTIFASLLVVATGLVACGGGGGSDDPQTIVNEATLQGIESGNLDLSLGLDIKGESGGHVDVSLSGPFQKEDEEELPELDLSAKAKGSVGGEDIDFEGALTLLPNKAFVEYSGTEYEVDSTTLNFVKSAIQKQTNKQGASGEGESGCQETIAGLEIGDFIENLKDEGSADVGGTSTTKVSGDLDAPGAIEALMEVIEDPACSEQLSGAGPLPSGAALEKAKRQVEEALKEAHMVLYVGDDHIVRRLTATATVEPSKGSARKSGAESIKLEFDMTLTGVNEGQTIAAPQHAKPLSDLFLKLGVNPLELAGALSGENGLEGLLEGLNGASSGGGGGSSGEGSGGSGGGGQQAYLNCIKEAQTPVDIQKCTGLLQ
jgi:hypothetical protein